MPLVSGGTLTSSRTTNIADPPGTGEEWLVWRFHLGAVVVAGCAHVLFALNKVERRG